MHEAENKVPVTDEGWEVQTSRIEATEEGVSVGKKENTCNRIKNIKSRAVA